MPAIDKQFIRTVLNNDKTDTKYNCFIETGTCTGETVIEVESMFDIVYTFEIQKQLQDMAKSRYYGNKIKFILGDTSDELEKILPNIDENVIFFLDAHWSDGLTGFGKKKCPLIEEIIHINNLFKNKAIVIIDDFRLFQTKDWEEIKKETIMNIFKDRIIDSYHIPSSYHQEDRLVIHLGKS